MTKKYCHILCISSKFFTFLLTVFLTTLVFSRLTGGTALAATLTINPSADAYVDQDNSQTNYGSSSEIRVDHSNTSSTTSYGALKFSLASVPNNAIITSAKIRLYSINCELGREATSVSLGVYKITSSWSESTIKWSNKPGYLPTNVFSSVSASAGYKEWTITSLFNSWLDGTTTNNGVYVLNGANGFACRFNSKEAASNKPQLVVTYTTLAILDVIDPTISNVRVQDLTTTGARITWTTNEAADSYINYYRDSDTGINIISTRGSADYVTSHSVTLSNLSGGSRYRYQVSSKDRAGNEAHTVYATFSTPFVIVVAPLPPVVVVLAPVISNVAHGSITQTSARITWTTDINSDSYVDYGTSTAAASLRIIGNESNVTSHAITLTGLLANTTYYYKVKSNGSTSSEFRSFRTLAATDAAAPVISSIRVSDITTTGAKITWTTNESASSWVFTSTNASDSTPILQYERYFGQNDAVTAHSVTVNNLQADTEYSYRVVSFDAARNAGVSVRKTFSTGEEEEEDDVVPAAGAAGSTGTGSSGTGTSSIVEEPVVPATGSAPLSLDTLAPATTPTDTQQNAQVQPLTQAQGTNEPTADPTTDETTTAAIPTPSSPPTAGLMGTLTNFVDTLNTKVNETISNLPAGVSNILGSNSAPVLIILAIIVVLGLIVVTAIVTAIITHHMFMTPHGMAGAAAIILAIAALVLFKNLQMQNDKKMEEAFRQEVAGYYTKR